MKYETLLKGTQADRETAFTESFATAKLSKNNLTAMQKQAAKILASMIDAKECEPGDIRKHAMKLTGEDIRDTMQNVYELLRVYQAISAGEIEITEEQFDAGEASKLALLSPFLEKEEYKPLLADAAKLALSGTARELRELKQGDKPKAEPKGEKVLREKFEAAEKDLTTKLEAAEAKLADSAARGEGVPVAFACTDIPAGTAVLRSGQLRGRLRADILHAMNSGDAGEMDFQLATYAKIYDAVCVAMGADPAAALREIAANRATPAAAAKEFAGTTIDAQGELVA